MEHAPSSDTAEGHRATPCALEVTLVYPMSAFGATGLGVHYEE